MAETDGVEICRRARIRGHAISPEELRGILTSEGIVKAAAVVYERAVANPERKKRIDAQEASGLLLAYMAHWLKKGHYQDVARVLWAPELFTTEAESVSRIWRLLPSSSQMIVIGAAACGKSYTAAVWLLLDWLADPFWTCVKVISVSREHAQRNVFAHIKRLHALSAIPLPGDSHSSSIMANDDPQQGIHLLAIPQGDDGKGRFRGFHPVPRGKPDDHFGTHSRVRAILDEAEDIPVGVWEGVDNLLSSEHDGEHVKVFAATNPKDKNSAVLRRAEPPGGWGVGATMDDGPYEWKSDLGYDVVRIDGAKTENVSNRRIIFPGMMTWDGFQRYARLGTGTPEYQTMARGWPPEQGIYTTAIPQHFIDGRIGTFTLFGHTTAVAGLDVAFEGDDSVVLAVGKVGNATAFLEHKTGNVEKFAQPRAVIVVEALYELPKKDTLDLADDVVTTCRDLGIDDEHLAVDRTGNGTGVHDALRAKLGGFVRGVMFGESATTRRILADDGAVPADLYDNVVTEMHFAVRKFLEFGFMAFSPVIDISDVRADLTDRRYRQTTGKKVRLERKADFKARNGRSPDFGDALCLMVHAVRMSGLLEARMLPEPKQDNRKRKHGLVDTLKFVDFRAD